MSIAVLRHRRWLPLAAAAPIAIALLSGSCRAASPATAVQDLAEAYVRITLQFAQHRPSLVEGWRGPATWTPGPRIPVAMLRDSLDQLIAQAEDSQLGNVDSTEIPRVAYLRGQLRALRLVARRLLGDTFRFDEEARLAFGVALPRLDQRRMATSRAAMESELRGSGSLDARYRDFRNTFIIPADRWDRVLDTALSICRERSAFPLPGDERVQIAIDPAVEWTAFARYRGGHLTVVTFATRAGHDVAGLLHTVCHETYAGHHAQHVLIDDALVRGRGWLEFELTPGFGPHLMMSEGAAETGADLALPEEVRQAAYARLLSAAGLPTSDAPRLARVATLASDFEPAVAWRVAQYLDNDSSRDEAARALASEALLPAPELFLSFVERQRTGAVVHAIGKAVVADAIERIPESERWRWLRDIFTLQPFTLK